MPPSSSVLFSWAVVLLLAIKGPPNSSSVHNGPLLFAAAAGSNMGGNNHGGGFLGGSIGGGSIGGGSIGGGSIGGGSMGGGSIGGGSIGGGSIGGGLIGGGSLGGGSLGGGSIGGGSLGGGSIGGGSIGGGSIGGGLIGGGSTGGVSGTGFTGGASGGGSTGGGGSGKDGEGEANSNSADESKNDPKKKKEGPQQGRLGPPRNPPRQQQQQQSKDSNKGLAQALPLLWNAASNTSAASDEATELEEYNAALSRIFERRMAFQPRYRGALEDINEAMSRDLLETNKKMSASERQKILYSLGGRGTYLEVPPLLLELREEADHPVAERLRIQGLHRQRRRGIPINFDDLRKRPFVHREFTGPVTTVDYETDLTEADIHQRQSGINGWLQMQNRARVLQKQHLRHRRNVGASDPVYDDDFQIDEEDLVGLSFNGKLSKDEGGEYGEEYLEYIEGEAAKGSDSEEEVVEGNEHESVNL
ncbi:hypothetical protein, conserved [Eimeria maxima]|uniref:Uncharacterized protein n=1 Tax=Eimeria maxima TaxID=5804 RepID=U6M1J8_EIMMA|nr:hypothetical protein, conserved [Eimeria maxima]CDJ56334.1 hypothetical protein, conserved [Eimeria maxima]